MIWIGKLRWPNWNLISIKLPREHDFSLTFLEPSPLGIIPILIASTRRGAYRGSDLDPTPDFKVWEALKLDFDQRIKANLSAVFCLNIDFCNIIDCNVFLPLKAAD